MALKLRHHDRKTHLRRVPQRRDRAGDLRGGRAGPRRGAGRPPHGRRRRQSRGPVAPALRPARPCPHQVQGRRADRRGDRPDRPRAASGRRAAGSGQGDGRHVARRCRVRRRPRLPEAARSRSANQESFARAARQLIRDLKLGDESADLQDEDDQESQDQENADGQSNETGDDQSDSSETHGYGAQGEETEDASDQEDASETVADQAQTEMQMGRATRRSRAAPSVLAAAGRALQRAAGPAVSRLYGEVRRDRRGRRAVRRRGARPPAQPARPAAQPPAGRDRQARQPPAAPPDGAAEPLVGVRPRRGHARRRAPRPHRRQSHARRSPSRRRRRPSSATPSCRC